MLRTIKRIGLTALIIATGFALIFVLLIFLSINRFPETSLKYIDDYLLASFDINYEKINQSVSLSDSTFLGVVQHKGESGGFLKKVGADNGGQIFIFKIIIII